ncbi:MAG: F0F1 ATP synthase subunit A [Muribaculum sp.]|nr:F0F1 ATP synthase subunit A [Muribaculaceae bacterium]MCM1080472.1 F0F1 ATP synthase subunit A [Muribaculum sp.]
MKRVLLTIILVVAVAAMAMAQTDSVTTATEAQPTAQEQTTPSEKEEKKINPKEIIFEHLTDGYGWEVPFSHENRIPLPIIVRDYEGHWHCFSSARLQHGKEYDGFRLGADDSKWHNKIVGERPAIVDGVQVMEEYRPIDLSITKNVLALFITIALVMWMVLRVAAWYKQKQYKAPRKFTGAIEALIEFVYNGVIVPTLGSRAHRFAPYLLTLFLFILVMNLMGLVVIFPGGANLTGNIAVTLVMALITFFITNLCGTKHYWKDIFWPDVPLWLKFPIPIMPIIELFGVFTKPAALTIRLFANMLGGHIVVIVLTLLIFILGAFGAAVTGMTTVVSVCFSIFMLLIDVLVSFIQAYVFTMLSTLFIALSTETGQHPQHETQTETK